MPNSYDDRVREAFEAVCARDPEGVSQPVRRRHGDAEARHAVALDTVIDIADIMRRLFGPSR